MKTKKMFVGTLGVLFMLSLMGGTTSSEVLDQNTAEMLYEEAMLKKDGDGNLPAAIKLFQQILTEFPQNRKIAGQAQLQIGLCYEKLGESEALKAYQAVVEKFGDQSEVLKTAKERIAVLESKSSSLPEERSELSLKKISIPFGEPSPDGKWVAYGDDQGGGLYLHEVSTGNKKVLVEKGGDFFVDAWFPGNWWSPSGNNIAYVLWHTPGGLKDLHLIDSSGLNHRLLFSNDEINVDRIEGWTPDEKYVFVSLWYKDRTVSIAKISTYDGQMEELIKSDHSVSGFSRLSPNGQYIAHNFTKEKYSSNLDIRLYSLNGAPPVDIITHPAKDKLIDWSPGGEYILFESDRVGDTGIWALAINNGKPIGEAKLIKTFSGGLMPMGFTDNGDFYFYESQRGEDVYTAQIDLETGATLQKPEKIEKKYSGYTTNSFWPNDGKYLGYFVRSEINIFTAYTNKLRINSIADGSNRDILLGFEASTMRPPKWSSDGKSLYMTGRKDRKFNFFKLDVDTGKTEILLDNKSGSDWSSDGRNLYKVGSNREVDISKVQNWIIQIDTKTGEETELFRTKPGQSMNLLKLSHDEKWIGFKLNSYDEQFITRYTKICIVPVGGGEVHEIFRAKDKSRLGNFWWGPPGAGILFSVALEEDKAFISQEIQLWYISSLMAQSPRKLDLEIYGLTQLSFHPDGKTITFTANDPAVTNIWVMENYLPKEKK